MDEPAAAAEAFVAMKGLGFSRVTSVAGREAFFANQGQLVIRDGDRLLFVAGPGSGMDRETVEQRVATRMLR